MSTTTAPERTDPPAPKGDERVSSSGRFTKVLRRPEIGAMAGALVIFLFFAIRTDSFFEPAGASTWIFNASTIGIMAVAVSLLMIGGEFDLSAGAMIGTTGLTTGILMTQYDLNVWLSILLSLVLALAIGALNGSLVMRTKLPSFIVTLGTFFVLQGVNLAVTKILIGKVSVTGLQDAAGYFDGKQIFGSFVNIDMGVGAVAGGQRRQDHADALRRHVLVRRRDGGGDLGAAANPGGQLDLRRRRRAGQRPPGRRPGLQDQGGPLHDHRLRRLAGRHARGSSRRRPCRAPPGWAQEFIFIICAVVGGCLLTGGYGSAIGAAFGALIYGMVQQGIPQAGWDNDWLYAFLGVMLLGAVLVNNWVKTRAESMR